MLRALLVNGRAVAREWEWEGERKPLSATSLRNVREVEETARSAPTPAPPPTPDSRRQTVRNSLAMRPSSLTRRKGRILCDPIPPP